LSPNFVATASISAIVRSGWRAPPHHHGPVRLRTPHRINSVLGRAAVRRPVGKHNPGRVNRDGRPIVAAQQYSIGAQHTIDPPALAGMLDQVPGISRYPTIPSSRNVVEFRNRER
jgi:hypothetical protein